MDLMLKKARNHVCFIHHLILVTCSLGLCCCSSRNKDLFSPQRELQYSFHWQFLRSFSLCERVPQPQNDDANMELQSHGILDYSACVLAVHSWLAMTYFQLAPNRTCRAWATMYKLNDFVVLWLVKRKSAKSFIYSAQKITKERGNGRKLSARLGGMQVISDPTWQINY